MEDKIPFELWLKILSYLPQSYKRKMIGVNRSLFEYAMDEVFRKLTLAADDERALFMITRLQDENVAGRVNCLTIRLSSIPGSQRQSYVEDLGRTPKTWKHKFFWFLKSKESKMVLGRIHRFSEQWDLNDMFWSFAERSIVLCTNAQELHIVLDSKGSQIPQSFKSFFHSIWLPGSILPGVRKLTIDATAHNFSTFILPMYQFSNFWRHLEHVEINIDPSHKSVINYLLMHSFFDSLKDKLVSLTLSGHLIPNIANILRFSPKFSKLRKFEIHSIFNIQNIQQVEHLNSFLSTHSETLENVLISPQVRAGWPSFTSNVLFIRWLGLTDHEIPNPSGQKTLSQLSLPQLRTLELRYDHQWIDGPIHYRVVFPQFNTLTPNLTTLAITQAEMSLGRVSQLISLLPRGQDGSSAIERLDLSIEILPPELVDLLSSEMQTLKWLKLRLSRYIVSSDLEQYMFYQIIRTRKYPSWTLEHLRIVASSRCGTPHPNTLAMQAVAETLLDPPILDASYECQCPLL